jgi:hypothetical protein
MGDSYMTLPCLGSATSAGATQRAAPIAHVLQFARLASGAYETLADGLERGKRDDGVAAVSFVVTVDLLVAIAVQQSLDAKPILLVS